MATYNTYVSIPHASYVEWRYFTLGNSYDVDGVPAYQPYQCWDFASEFWWNVGFPTNYPITGGDNARGIWTNREQNKGDVFDLITDINSLQVGDVICFSVDPYGHVGFLDETYDGGGYFKLLSQNVLDQDYVTAQNYPVDSFQGAFRYKGWHNIPPTPSETKKNKFPWVLYARKLRNNY